MSIPTRPSGLFDQAKKARELENKIHDLIHKHSAVDFHKLYETNPCSEISMSGDPVDLGAATTATETSTKSGAELIEEIEKLREITETNKRFQEEIKAMHSAMITGGRAMGKSFIKDKALGMRGLSASEVVFDNPAVRAPVITLNGGTTWNTIDPKRWRDPGFTANDSEGNDITDRVEVYGEVGKEPGTYTLEYVVGDAYGNTARASRTVNVIEEWSMHQEVEPEEQSFIDQITDADQLDFDDGIDMRFQGGMVAIRYTNGQFRKKRVDPCTLVAKGAYNGKKKGVIIQFETDNHGIIASVAEKSGMTLDLIEIPMKELTNYFPIPQVEHALFMARRPGDTVDLHSDELTAELPDFGVF